MLKKLIKYDLKWLLKNILIFHSIGLFFGIIGRVTELLPDSTFFEFISAFCKGASLSLIISGFVNCVIRSWVRLILNMYKDESYLTHTLPISKTTHMLSKILSSIIIIVMSIVILFIDLVIMYYSKETLEFLKLTLNIVSNNLGLSIAGFIILIMLVIIVEIIFMVLLGYLGIVYGYSYNQKKLLKSFIYGFGSYLAVSAVTIGMLLLGSLFNDSLKGIILGGTTYVDFNALKGIFVFTFFIYVVYNVIISYLMIKKINKGVNID